jgi:hypothetical protein
LTQARPLSNEAGMLVRLVGLAPLLLLGSGCSLSTRLGPQVRTLPERSPAMEGQLTLAPGIGEPPYALAVPVTLTEGASLRGGGEQSTWETGLELSGDTGLIQGSQRIGYRASARYGGGIEGPTGNYAALRFGPSWFYLPEERRAWGVNLEALVGVQTTGAHSDSAVLGLALTGSYDLASEFKLNLAHGRPLRDARGHAWHGRARAGERKPERPSGSEALGLAWLAEGLAEHASIASFWRLAEELRTLGAPRAMIARAVGAAIEEAGHTALCFELAADELGQAVWPEGVPDCTPRDGLSLAALAQECWKDGCLGEGAASSFAKRRAATARGPKARRALSLIAREERAHAELAWDIARFCLQRGGAEVREAWHDAVFAAPLLAEEQADSELFHACWADTRRAALSRSQRELSGH